MAAAELSVTSDELVKALEEVNLSEHTALAEDILPEMLATCLVPQFQLGQDKPAEEKDFIMFQPVIEENLLHLGMVLKQLTALEDAAQVEKMFSKQEILVPYCILLGENHKKFVWNTNTTVEYCNEFSDILTKFRGGKTVQQVMMSQKLVVPILTALQPKLSRTKWKEHPAAVMCYVWVLLTLESPHLSPHLTTVSPTALLLTDDFISDNRILGVSCLHHIIQNVTAAELVFHGHGEVMLKAVDRLLHMREAPLVSAALPCLLSLLSKLEVDLGNKPEIRQWSRFDDLLETVLRNMQLEHAVALRDAYSTHLKDLIQAADFRVMRWSKRLFRVLSEYLEVSMNHMDFKTTLACLQALECYLEISRPVVILLYAYILLFLLLKTLYCIISTTQMAHTGAETAVVSSVVSCLTTILHQLSPTDKKGLKSQINEKLTNKDDCRFVALLNKIL